MPHPNICEDANSFSVREARNRLGYQFTGIHCPWTATYSLGVVQVWLQNQSQESIRDYLVLKDCFRKRERVRVLDIKSVSIAFCEHCTLCVSNKTVYLPIPRDSVVNSVNGDLNTFIV
jgi:hypothetical protein